MESIKTHKIISLIGIAALAVGVFVPVLRYPATHETYDYFDLDSENGVPADGPGVYILIVVAVSLLLVGMDRLEYLWLPAVIVFWVLFPNFATTWSSEFERNNTTQLGEGWLFLLGGPVLMTAPLWFDSLRQIVVKPVLISDQPEEITEEQSDEQ